MDSEMTPRHCKSAFTLIELILAISLLATITVTAYLCLSTATRSWRVGVESADAVNHGDYIMEQILMGLRSAYYPEVGTVNDSTGQYGMQLVNDGDEEDAQDSLTWVKIGSALVGADSEVANTPHKVVLSIVRKGESENEDLDAGGLVLKSWRMSALPEDFDSDDENYVKPLLLMPGVVGLNFRVFNPKDNLEEGKLPGVKDEESSFELDEEENWIDDDWTGDYTNRLPYAVEATLYLEPPDDRSEPIKVQRVTTLPTAFLSWPEKFGKSSSSRNSDGSNGTRNSDGGNRNRNSDGGNRNRNPDGGNRNWNSNGDNRSRTPDGGNRNRNFDGGNRNWNSNGDNRNRSPDGGNRNRSPDGGNRSRSADGGSKK